jgi:hypothetical protein
MVVVPELPRSTAAPPRPAVFLLTKSIEEVTLKELSWNRSPPPLPLVTLLPSKVVAVRLEKVTVLPLVAHIAPPPALAIFPEKLEPDTKQLS